MKAIHRLFRAHRRLAMCIRPFCYSLRHYRWLGVALMLYACSSAAQNPLTIQTFHGGIHALSAKQCLRKLDHAHCKLNNLSNPRRACIEQILSKTPVCQQTLAFFKLSGGAVFEKIKKYGALTVILANYRYISDQSADFFIVTPAGQFIALPLAIPKNLLIHTKGYAKAEKMYAHITPWQIRQFPRGFHIKHNRYRLIFKQELKNGCNACTRAGNVEIAYDFSKNGSIFYGIHVLKLNLIPKPS